MFAFSVFFSPLGSRVGREEGEWGGEKDARLGVLSSDELSVSAQNEGLF